MTVNILFSQIPSGALTRTELRELRSRISRAKRREWRDHYGFTETWRELRELLEDIDEAYCLRGLR